MRVARPPRQAAAARSGSGRPQCRFDGACVPLGGPGDRSSVKVREGHDTTGAWDRSTWAVQDGCTRHRWRCHLSLAPRVIGHCANSLSAGTPAGVGLVLGGGNAGFSVVGLWASGLAGDLGRARSGTPAPNRSLAVNCWPDGHPKPPSAPCTWSCVSKTRKPEPCGPAGGWAMWRGTGGPIQEPLRREANSCRAWVWPAWAREATIGGLGGVEKDLSHKHQVPYACALHRILAQDWTVRSTTVVMTGAQVAGWEMRIVGFSGCSCGMAWPTARRCQNIASLRT